MKEPYCTSRIHWDSKVLFFWANLHKLYNNSVVYCVCLIDLLLGMPTSMSAYILVFLILEAYQTWIILFSVKI